MSAARLDVALGETRARVRARDADDWETKDRALIASCHPKQRAALLDPHRRVDALTGRGAGKTTFVRGRFMRRMGRTPGAHCLYVATTRDQAIDLMWTPIKEIADRLSISATFNETSLRCTFRRNKAQLRLVGADDKRQIEKYRGLPHHEVWIDEAASYPPQLLEHLIERIIGPRLGDFGGMLGMVGTPGHVLAGPFYEATRPGSPMHRPWGDADAPPAMWSHHSWTLQDGAPYVPAMARLWQEALVEKADRGWSDNHPVWMREYLGQWAADDTESIYRYRAHDLTTGADHNQWDPPIDPRTRVAKLPEGDWRYVYGLDLGHSDPMAVVIFAYQPSERILRQIYNFEKRGMFAKTIAELLLGPELDHENPTGLFGVTGWPEAIVADTSNLGGALLDELAQVYGIQIAPAQRRDKFDHIELFNGELVDGRIKVLKGSSLEEQLLQLQWQADEYGRLKETKGQANHSADAAIYARTAAAARFKEEPVAPPPAQLSEFQKAGRERLVEKPSRGEYDGLLDDDGYFGDDAWG